MNPIEGANETLPLLSQLGLLQFWQIASILMIQAPGPSSLRLDQAIVDVLLGASAHWSPSCTTLQDSSQTGQLLERGSSYGRFLGVPYWFRSRFSAIANPLT